jgi:hypothetical protein
MKSPSNYPTHVAFIASSLTKVGEVHNVRPFVKIVARNHLSNWSSTRPVNILEKPLFTYAASPTIVDQALMGFWGCIAWSSIWGICICTELGLKLFPTPSWKTACRWIFISSVTHYYQSLSQEVRVRQEYLCEISTGAPLEKMTRSIQVFLHCLGTRWLRTGAWRLLYAMREIDDRKRKQV